MQGGTLEGSNTLDSDSVLLAEVPDPCGAKMVFGLGLSVGFCSGTTPAANPSGVDTKPPDPAPPSIQIPNSNSVPNTLNVNPPSQPSNGMNNDGINQPLGSPEAPSNSPEAPSNPLGVPATSPKRPSNSRGAPSGSNQGLNTGDPNAGSGNAQLWDHHEPYHPEGELDKPVWDYNHYNRNQDEKFDEIRHSIDSIPNLHNWYVRATVKA